MASLDLQGQKKLKLCGFVERTLSPFPPETRGTVEYSLYDAFDNYRNESNVNFKVASENTLIILDWDDTLLASSWLFKNEITLQSSYINSQASDELKALDRAVLKFLRKVIYLYGRVIIVTNAQEGWIQLSSQKFLPLTYNLIFELEKEGNRISTFSARSKYENINPFDPAEWKRQAFLHLIKNNISSEFLPICSPSGSVSSASIQSLTEVEQESKMDEYFEGNLKRQKANKELIQEQSYIYSLDLEELTPVEVEETSFDFNENMEVESSSDNTLLFNKQNNDKLEETESLFSVDFPTFCRSKSYFDNESWEYLDRLNSFEVTENDYNATVKCTPTVACNIIAIGDCLHDCDSLRDIDLSLRNTIRKTVKLIDIPNIYQVIKQLESLENQFDQLYSYTNDIDFAVDKDSI